MRKITILTILLSILFFGNGFSNQQPKFHVKVTIDYSKCIKDGKIICDTYTPKIDQDSKYKNYLPPAELVLPKISYQVLENTLNWDVRFIQAEQMDYSFFPYRQYRRSLALAFLNEVDIKVFKIEINNKYNRYEADSSFYDVPYIGKSFRSNPNKLLVCSDDEETINAFLEQNKEIKSKTKHMFMISTAMSFIKKDNFEKANRPRKQELDICFIKHTIESYYEDFLIKNPSYYTYPEYRDKFLEMAPLNRKEIIKKIMDRLLKEKIIK